MQKQLAAVLIPIYKESLTKDELISLRQCISVLAKHQLIIVCPESLKLDCYLGSYSGFKVEPFHDDFFKSIDGYNKLLMSKQFYKRFLDYEYILIYQLDAFVFRDELEYWCSLNFDYIGSPWFDNTAIPIKDQVLYGVGNGGFSLRKVKSHYTALNFYWVHFFLKSLYESRTQYLLLKKNSFSSFLHLFGAYFSRIFSIPSKKLRQIKLNEDKYWCLVVPKLNHKFRLAPIELGIKFAFEENPRILYEMNNQQLPFGCHAWNKCGQDFWKEFIQ